MYGFDTRSSFCRRKISSKVAACWLQNTLFLISRHLSDIICQILSVSSDNCQLGHLSARTTVSSDNCQLRHLSARTTVRPDNCKVSNCQNPMDNCQIKLSELWKNCQSYGKTVSSDSCPLKTVRPDSCPPRLFC